MVDICTYECSLRCLQISYAVPNILPHNGHIEAPLHQAYNNIVCSQDHISTDKSQVYCIDKC